LWPAGSSVYARTTGPIVATGGLAHLEALTTGRSGTVRVTHADITAADEGSGDMEIGSAGELTAVTGTGHVPAAVADPAAATVAGHRNITIHAHAAAHITAATMDGDITIYTHPQTASRPNSAPKTAPCESSPRTDLPPNSEGDPMSESDQT
jgi:hypothetical protein